MGRGASAGSLPSWGSAAGPAGQRQSPTHSPRLCPATLISRTSSRSPAGEEASRCSSAQVAGTQPTQLRLGPAEPRLVSSSGYAAGGSAGRQAGRDLLHHSQWGQPQSTWLPPPQATSPHHPPPPAHHCGAPAFYKQWCSRRAWLAWPQLRGGWGWGGVLKRWQPLLVSMQYK